MNHTKPFWFLIRWGIGCAGGGGGGGWGGGAVWNGNKGRQTESCKERPELSWGWSCTYLEVCDLIKAKLLCANKFNVLAIWNYYTRPHTQTHSASTQTVPMRNIISTSKLSKVERAVINIVMRNNLGWSGQSGWLTPKQTSPGLANNCSAEGVITASSNIKKRNRASMTYDSLK